MWRREAGSGGVATQRSGRGGARQGPGAWRPSGRGAATGSGVGDQAQLARRGEPGVPRQHPHGVAEGARGAQHEVAGELVGDVRSQVWSPRYNKYLTMVMMKREFLADNSSITIDGKVGNIVDLPFNLKSTVES